jgi:YVTN family beta-propeller protein
MNQLCGGIRQQFFQARWLAGLLFVALLAGCGNEFRPVAIPIIPPGGTPQALRHAIVVSGAASGGSSIAGTSTNIDVAGDSVFTMRRTSVNPVHAGLAAGQGRLIVANSDDSLTTYATFATLGQSGTTTITLPQGSEPRFMHTREANTAYVALHGANFDPACGANGAVGVISTLTLTLSATVCAGAGPVALAELPNGSKLYIANEGSGNVTVMNTADHSIAATIPAGTSPSWIDVNGDGTLVFVANAGSNDVTVIDTAADAAIKNVTVGTTPTFLRFDASRKRVYVTNTADNSISIIDADPSSATYLLSPATAVAVGTAPRSVTALANGTKVYVANSTSNTVSVIDAATTVVTGTIAVGTTPISIDSSSDSAQVFVANQGAVDASGNVSVIRTSDDTKFIDIAMPAAADFPAGTVVNPKFLLVTP